MINIAIVIALLALLVTQYLDVNSTKQGIKKNLTHESNPAMAWLIKTFPNYWGYIKAAAMFSIGLAVAALVPKREALVLLVLIDAVFLWAALQNYQLGDGN